MRRVVVTGIGLLTPLGQGAELSWKSLLAGNSGAGRITTFDPTDYACQVACEVPRVDGRGGGGANEQDCRTDQLRTGSSHGRSHCLRPLPTIGIVSLVVRPHFGGSHAIVTVG